MYAWIAARFGNEASDDYGWIIDRDVAAEQEPDGKSRVGTMGPRTIPLEIEQRLLVGEGRAFRMVYDSDGPGEPVEERIAYEGRYLDVSDIGGEPDDGDEFGPLNDLGRPDVGASEIHYRQPDGTWKPL